MSKPESSFTVYDPETVKGDPSMVRFYETINQEISDSLKDSLAKHGSIENMPTDEWSTLRNRLLALKIVLQPNGEVVYE